MELSRNSSDGTRRWTRLGRCRHFFWLGVVFDTVGLTVLFTGVFADLLFYDLLLYLGSIIIFFSLLWWVFWYTGNIELSAEDALKRPFPVPSSTVVEALSQGVGHRLSFTVCSVSTTLLRIRRRRRPRRVVQRTASLSMTVTDQVERQLEKEAQDKDGMRSVQESGAAQDVCRGDLGPKAETVEGSEAVRPPGPDAGPLDPEAGLPRFVKRPSAHLVQPEFSLPPLDQAPPPAILPSESLPVVPLASTCQPLAILTSKSHSVLSWASVSQPPVTLASASQPAVPLASTSQLPLILASQSLSAVPLSSTSQTLVPVASQSHPLVPPPAQSRLPVPLASQSQLQNVSWDSQTQPVQASQAQAGATPLPLIQLLPAQPFQTQPMDLWAAPAVPDLQALYPTQQGPHSSSLVQEIAPGQAASTEEFRKQPVAQAFETPPPAGQELSRDLLDTASPLPEPPAPATQAQHSVPSESAPAPASEKKSPAL